MVRTGVARGRIGVGCEVEEVKERRKLEEGKRVVEGRKEGVWFVKSGASRVKVVVG